MDRVQNIISKYCPHTEVLDLTQQQDIITSPEKNKYMLLKKKSSEKIDKQMKKLVQDVEKKQKEAQQQALQFKKKNINKSFMKKSYLKLDLRKMVVQNIEKLLNNYKVMIKLYERILPNSSQQLKNFRRNQYIIFMKYLFLGVEEYKTFTELLSLVQDNKIATFSLFETYAYIKVVIQEIDDQLFLNLNLGDNRHLHIQYKNQWKNIIRNIQDPYNFEFRKNIITKTIDGSKLSQMTESRMYSQKKRKAVEQQRMRIIIEHQAQNNIIRENPQSYEQESKQATESENKNDLFARVTFTTLKNMSDGKDLEDLKAYCQQELNKIH